MSILSKLKKNRGLVGGNPVGTIISYFGESAPDGYLKCDGATYNKADYPELSSLLLSLTTSTPYVVDGDDTKFKVPDLQGEFLRGTGTNSYTNQGSGANVGTHQNATEVPYLTSSNAGTSFLMGYGSTSVKPVPRNSDYNTTTGTKWASATSTTTDRGATGAVTIGVRPTNTSVLYCIKC